MVMSELRLRAGEGDVKRAQLLESFAEHLLEHREILYLGQVKNMNPAFPEAVIDLATNTGQTCHKCC